MSFLMNSVGHVHPVGERFYFTAGGRGSQGSLTASVALVSELGSGRDGFCRPASSLRRIRPDLYEIFVQCTKNSY